MKQLYHIVFIFIFQLAAVPANGMFARRVSRLKTASSPVKSQSFRPMQGLQTQTPRTFALRSWFDSKLTALKTTIQNYWYKPLDKEIQSISLNPTSSLAQKPIVAPFVPEPEQSVSEIESEEMDNKLRTQIERIKTLLEVEVSELNVVLILNLLSQLSANVDSPEVEALKQTFFEKITFDNVEFVEWLKTHSPKELYALLPNNIEMVTHVIKVLYKKMRLRMQADSSATFWLRVYEEGLYRYLDLKQIDDLTYIILNLMRDDYGRVFVERWIDDIYMDDSVGRDSDTFRKFIHIVKQNRDLFLNSKDGLAWILRYIPGPDFLEIVFDIDSSYNQTPSYRHLQRYKYELNESVFHAIFSDHNVQLNIIHKAIDKEKELMASGYVVMYHARSWKYGFLSDIYALLYEYKSGKKLKDFIFTHLDDPVLGRVSERFYASEKEKRERLIKEGNPYDSKTHVLGSANRNSLLFLNKFLFGNLTKLGSCSMYYVLANHNMGEVDFSLAELFNMFGCSDVYRAFKLELDALQVEYANLTQYGQLLQIAVPEKNVDTCIYYTTSGGPKKEYERYVAVRDKNGSIINHNLQATTDTKAIVKAFDKNPQDVGEFVLINTRDQFGGLNPESGIKVFSYNAVDPEKWSLFEEKKHALFARIVEWMQHHDAS